MTLRSMHALLNGPLDAEQNVRDHRALALSIGARLNAFTEVTEEGADRPGPLHGVPVAVKDAFVDGGRAPTMGSKVHPRGMTGTAEVLTRLRGAGATILGYTNLHEWAIGTTSAITATGPIRNPWDERRIAGGSSGGSAAAVAAGIVPVAIGTDAGGSVRIPAACCGVVGLKPSFGAIPLDGEVSADSPINHCGVFTRAVEDAAIMFELLALRRVAEVDTSGLVVGIPDSFFYDDVQPEVDDVVEDASRLLGAAMGGVRSVPITGIEHSADGVSKELLPHMARLVAADLEERPDDFDPWTLKALRRGAAMDDRAVDLAPYRAAWDAAFESCDVMVVPTLPAVPPLIEDHKLELPSGPVVADLAMYSLNSPMNTGGVPALAVPCGEIDGMPVSVTLVARRGAEDVLFATGRLLEDVVDRAYRGRIAPLSG